MIMKRNPVFWLMWAIPATAVCASLSMLAVAIDGADPRLPPNYHWEGAGLDQDFERARRAFALGIAGTLDLHADRRECVLTLAGDASAEVRADSLLLLLTHSHAPALDRQVLLRRSPAGEFIAACDELPAGKWRIALDDAAGKWSLRTEFNGNLRRIELRAREPGGGAS